jgi:hypothetical protein
VQQEGYDAHDFNLFDDRSSELWRKPYVDGAVRELTAGDSRSQEQVRQAVEQMMIAARPGPFPPAAHIKLARGRAEAITFRRRLPFLPASWSIRGTRG